MQQILSQSPDILKIFSGMPSEIHESATKAEDCLHTCLSDILGTSQISEPAIIPAYNWEHRKFLLGTNAHAAHSSANMRPTKQICTVT